MVVEEDHDDAGDVEGGERRVDDEIGVVKAAVGRDASLRVVQAEDDGQTDGHRDGPHQADGQPHPLVVLVAGVLEGLSHRDVPSSIIHHRESMPQKVNIVVDAFHLY